MSTEHRQQLIRIQGPTDAIAAITAVSGRALRSIDIFSHQLSPPIYADDALVENISKLVRRSAQSKLRILLRDTRPLYGSDHPLLSLVQRLPSHAQIRRYVDGAQNPNYGFLCADESHLVYFSDEPTWNGFARHEARAKARTSLDEFNTLWTYGSKPDPNLRRLTI